MLDFRKSRQESRLRKKGYDFIFVCVLSVLKTIEYANVHIKTMINELKDLTIGIVRLTAKPSNKELYQRRLVFKTNVLIYSPTFDICPGHLCLIHFIVIPSVTGPITLSKLGVLLHPGLG